jgi:glycosyltransferase involved in cell wall biosynthesis
MAGKARVLTIEVSTTSTTYAWEPSGDIAGAEKITLFPGQAFEKISRVQRFRKLFATLRQCDIVFFGVSYNEPDIIALSWLLRFMGVKVMMMTASKYDDFPRTVWFEVLKSAILSSYRGAIVGGRRQADYLRFLGFRKRTVLPGYNSVGLDRVRAQGGHVLAPAGTAFQERHFIYVGRFVSKKNMFNLIEAYARYIGMAGATARRLVLIGSGPLEQALRERLDALQIAHMVDFPGFLPAPEVSRALSRSLALVLVSTEEQWGLVVNEALAFGLPIVASFPLGACDALIRNLVNGFVVEPESVDGIASAMHGISADRVEWERMVAESHSRAWLADSERFADALEVIVDPSSEPARSRVTQFMREMAMPG